MSYNGRTYRRRSLRLSGYDYSSEGAYFITICCKDRECFFSDDLLNCELNDAGEMIQQFRLSLLKRFPHIILDEFVIMPNHFHGIIFIDHSETGGDKPAPLQKKSTISDIVGAFKSLTVNEYIRRVKIGQFPVFEKSIWQRNYHEHIIRDEESLDRIREYIKNNPLHWQNDTFFQ